MTRALVLMVGVLLLAAPPASAGERAFVRVNQAGYESGAPARAYLMSTEPVRGETFTVEDAGGVPAVAGAVGERLGTWSHSKALHYSVYALDFTVPDGAGYAIHVARVRSPAFSVGSPATLYGPLLGNALFYYDSVRDGPDFVRGPLSPAPAHLNDRRARTYYNPPIQRGGDEKITTRAKPLRRYGTVIDASGGHWDAGDNLKYVETESYTAALMEIALRDFPAQMGPAAAPVAARQGVVLPDFSGEVDFSLGFLSRMWDDRRRVLYLQVGNTQGWRRFPDLRGDYDFWRLPQKDDTAPDSPRGDKDGDHRYIRPRPVSLAHPPGAPRTPAGRPLSPNLAG